MSAPTLDGMSDESLDVTALPMPVGAPLADGTPPGRRRDPIAVGPLTHDRLVDEFRMVGISSGETVLVHSSLRSFGYVVGGAQTVVAALLDAVGEHGTIVVPTHTPAWSEPSHWHGKFPAAWQQVIRDSTPPFHPRVTPTAGMGAIVECFRRWPGCARSWHPRVSFAAIGPHATAILDDHSLTGGFGERSPLARLYERDALVALVGVDHSVSTMLHLAEHRATWPGKQWITQGASISADPANCPRPQTSGTWAEWRELSHDADDFAVLGEALDRSGFVEQEWVGAAPVRLMHAKAVVDFAVDWISDQRG